MAAQILINALAAFAAWVVADRVAHAALSRPHLFVPVARLSYGGVTRACIPAGGAALGLPLVCFGIPSAALGLVPLGEAALFTMGFLSGGVRLPRGSRRGLIIILMCSLPDGLAAAGGAFLAPILMRQADDADHVPGIPAALFAPALLGGGFFLTGVHGDGVGIVAIIIGGGLLGLHPLHRFPPRLTLGGGGEAWAAWATGLLAWHLWRQGAVLPVLLLWSFVWVEAGAALLTRRCRKVMPSFEQARLRGEPEAGLTLACASLSVAGVVLLWTGMRQPLMVQAVGFAVLLALQLQFRAFLVRGGTRTDGPGEPPVTKAEA